MEFKPTVNQALTIQGVAYRFTEDPAIPGKTFSRLGRSGTVFQLQAANGDLYALKIFLSPFRSPRVAESCERLRPYASFPGMQVCKRSALTAQNNPGLITQYENLANAVLMPWVPGETWQDFILSGSPLSVNQSHALARSLAQVLARLEKASLAHCDLSGSNLLLPGLVPVILRTQSGVTDPSLAALVDLEDLFTPNLRTPEKLPGGTAGYAHRTAPQGIWDPQGDRFAGAILLAEILGWCDERVRRLSAGDQYFESGEIHQDSERFQALLSSLDSHRGPECAALLSQAWDSYTLADCAPLAEWSRLLGAPEPGDESILENIMLSRKERPMSSSPSADDPRQRQARVAVERAEVWQQMGQTDKALQELEEAYSLSPAVAGAPLATLIRRRAEAKERSGNLQSALGDYQRALEIAPPGKLRDELSGIVSEITDKIDSAKRPPKTARCPICKREVTVGAPSCPHCGANLSQKTVMTPRGAPGGPSQQPVYPISSPPPQPVYEPYPTAPEQPPKKKKFPIWIPIVLVALLLVCGLSVGGFFFLGPGLDMFSPAPSNTPMLNPLLATDVKSPPPATQPPAATQPFVPTQPPAPTSPPSTVPPTQAPTRAVTNTAVPSPVPTQPPVAPTPKGALFFDDFSTRAKNWSENKEKVWESGYVDSGYYISSTIPDGFYYVLSPMANQTPNRTLTIKVRVRPDAAVADKGEFGIVGHFTNNKNYYRLGVSLANGGQYYLGRRLGGNYEYMTRGQWKPTTKLKPGDYNTISLAFTSDKIIINFNDNPIEELRDTYTFTGPAGIFIMSHNTDQKAGGLFKAVFDDFAIIAE